MALLGEEVVEEWLNRQGYFTIRGIHLGVHEIDILAFKPDPSGKHECRQIEVQVSTNPIAYVSKVPKALQRKRRVAPDSAKTRTPAELRQGIKEWIEKKFDHPKKAALRKRLFPGVWSRELVVHAVRHPEELELFREVGVNLIRFADIVREMENSRSLIASAAGNDLLTLMLLGKDQAERRPSRPRRNRAAGRR